MPHCLWVWLSLRSALPRVLARRLMPVCMNLCGRQLSAHCRPRMPPLPHRRRHMYLPRWNQWFLFFPFIIWAYRFHLFALTFQIEYYVLCLQTLHTHTHTHTHTPVFSRTRLFQIHMRMWLRPWIPTHRPPTLISIFPPQQAPQMGHSLARNFCSHSLTFLFKKIISHTISYKNCLYVMSAVKA
jgi:hypothetical protein